MRRLLFVILILLAGCDAASAQVSTIGTTAMGLPSTPGAIVTSPLNGPSPFSATTQPGAADTTLAAVPLASDPTTPGTVVICNVVDIPDAGTTTASTGARCQLHGKQPDLAFLAGVHAARHLILVDISPFDRADAAAARAASPARPFADRRAATEFIEHNHDDDALDRDDAGGPVGDHFDARRRQRDGDHFGGKHRQHDRHHIANVPAWQPIDHGMQFDAGWAADQWRGAAALDAANSGEPAARHDHA
jgi:hypothetical protein